MANEVGMVVCPSPEVDSVSSRGTESLQGL